MNDDPHRIAAASELKNLLVVAPPGCGKTEFLAYRADWLVDRLGPHQKILALTFTNKAKANLSERMRNVLGPQRARRYVRVRNFHGHATEIILAHGATIGLNVSTMKLPDTKTMGKAIRALTHGAAAPSTEQLLRDVKRNPLTDEEVLDGLEVIGDELAVQVERDRVAANQLHYEDLLRHAQRLLRIDEVGNLYRQHYAAVLVDEFQDLSLQQLDLVLRSCDTWKTFAGDQLQGIYTWAGAEPAKVEEVLRAGCAEPIQLTVSYRSSPAVLQMLNSVSVPLGAQPLTAYEPESWPGGGAAAAVVLDTKEREAAMITKASRYLLAVAPNTSIGVISRAGWRRREIDDAFAALPDLPCRRWDLAIDDPAILDQIRVAVRRLPASATIAEARPLVLAGIEPADVHTQEEIADAFDQLESEAGAGGDVRAVLDRFRDTDPEIAIGPGVHLLNAHTGKGQQFDWVFVCGMEQGHIPGRRSKTSEAVAEEQRVLLVMLSRARHGIVVSRSRNEDSWGRPKPVTESPWFSQLAAAATIDLKGLESHLHQFYPGGGDG